MFRLGAGLYADHDSTLHFDPDELCAFMGLTPTPENIKLAETIAITAILEKWPHIQVTHQSAPQGSEGEHGRS